MNKKQSRLFAIVATALATVAFLGLTLDSHRQFGKLTNADKITPEVTRGKDVWHQNNCINCHTLFGEGAYYAPDLTKITQHRGEAYLQAYMRDVHRYSVLSPESQHDLAVRYREQGDVDAARREGAARDRPAVLRNQELERPRPSQIPRSVWQ